MLTAFVYQSIATLYSIPVCVYVCLRACAMRMLLVRNAVFGDDKAYTQAVEAVSQRKAVSIGALLIILCLLTCIHCAYVNCLHTHAHPPHIHTRAHTYTDTHIHTHTTTHAHTCTRIRTHSVSEHPHSRGVPIYHALLLQGLLSVSRV